MRNLYKYLLAIPALLSLFMVSCDDDMSTTEMLADEEISAPIILNPTADQEFVLTKENEAQPIKIKWDKADYGVSLKTNYSIEIDAIDGDYSAPLSIGTSNIDSLIITQADLNKKVLELGLTPNEQGEVNLRVVAKVTDAIAVKYSPIVKIKITPYSTKFKSIYMIGAALNGWDPAKAVEVASTGEVKKFYTIAKFDASGDANFRFYSDTNWGASLGGYDLFTNYPGDLLEETGDGDKNFRFIGTSGWYKLSVDVATGSIEMTSTEEPLLYLTGDATHGWNWDAPTSIKWIGHEIWEGDVTFTQNNFFRLFGQKDWGPVSFGYDIITDYDTNIIIIAEGHSDPNWQFIGNSGVYSVKVDKRNGSILLTAK